MLEVKIYDFDTLKKTHPDLAETFNPHGDPAYFLVISINGEVIDIFSDRMEPEDVLFTRDLDWIKPLLLKVYKLGFCAALEEAIKMEKDNAI